MSETVKQGSLAQERPKSKLSPEKQKKQERVLFVLIAVIAVAVLFLLYRNGVIGGGSAQVPVEKYLTAIAERDFEAYTATMPQRIAQAYISDRDKLGYSGEEYLRELYSDYFTEFGEDMTVALDFTGRSRVENVYVQNFKDSYLEMYGEEIKISNALEIDVAARFSGSASSDSIDLECFVIKSGGKWYIVGCDYKQPEPEEK